MRFTASLSLLAGATVATAQLSFPSSFLGLTFSPPCQQAIISVLTNGSFAQCFHTTDLLPVVTSNGSIVPVLDKFMSDVCYTAPCSNATLTMATASILGGCAADLVREGLTNDTVVTAFSTYPLVREVLCLKTADPYTNMSYGGILGNPPIPITSPVYNSTGGDFCVTSLLTQLSAYFGTNLTLPYLEGVLSGMNTTGLGLVKSISPTILCDNCVFGTFDIIEDAYPMVGEVPLSLIYGLLNMTSPGNTTINEALNGTCAYKSLNVTAGVLPVNISVSVINSTFPLNVTSTTRLIV